METKYKSPSCAVMPKGRSKLETKDQNHAVVPRHGRFVFWRFNK